MARRILVKGLAGAVFGLLLLPSGFAQADDRDDDIFGGGEDEESAPEAADAEDRLAELMLVDEDAMFSRLGESDDTLELGGRMYLRLDYYLFDESGAQEQPLSSPNLVDLYLDNRPNDRLRGFVEGRLRYDPTVTDCDPEVEDCAAGFYSSSAQKTQVQLHQLWLKFDVARTVYVTAGRQRVKWGSGRFWNPTDFLNLQTLDPLAIFDERLGVDLVKLHLPVESLGWNLYAVANIQDAAKPEDVGGAVRAEVLLGPAELALSGAARRHAPLRLGADLSTAVWLLDVHVEGAVSRGVRNRFYEGEFDLGSLTFPREVDRSGDWIPQVVAGAEFEVGYSDTDTVLLGGEYFFNDAGYSDRADLYPWLLFNEAFRFFYVGRHYGAAYVYLPRPGDLNDWTFTLSTIANLSDRSVLGRLDVRVEALTYLSVNLYGQVHTGREGELRLGLELPEIPGVSDAVKVPTQVVDIGMGLTLRL